LSLISYITRVHFADRVLEDALSEEVGRNGMARPLVISEGAAPDGDGLERLFDALPVGAAPAHFQSEANGTPQALLGAAAAALSESGCDGIIGYGGMRPLDLARLLGDAGHAVIAVPTGTHTIGLGPLGTGFAPQAPRRVRIPVAILCDATLALDVGPAETAAGGMDALVHCLESFLSTAFNPPADGMALDGLRRAWLNLEAAVEDGRDLSARRELLAAALDAGLASEKGFGGIEAAAHGLEATSAARHGVLHGALLPEVMSFNAPAVSDRAPAIRTALGLSPDADFVAHLALLAERIGLPVRLSEAGIEGPILERAARRAAAAAANRTNPRHATARDYEAMMRAVL